MSVHGEIKQNCIMLSASGQGTQQRCLDVCGCTAALTPMLVDGTSAA